MKALGLLLLRCALAVLVAVWAAALVASPEGGIAPLGVWVPSLAIDPLSVQLAGGLGAVLALQSGVTLDQFRDVIVQSCPLGRIGEPEDMAGVAIYLASQAGAYLTCAVIPVDGGTSTTK